LCECTQCIGLAFLLYVCLYVYVVIQPLAAKPNKSINQSINVSAAKYC